MPKPYSLDLRERVVGFVEDGQSRRAAAARFRVSVSFVVNLMKAVRARGSFAPKPSGGGRHAKLEPHRAFLLAQVAEKADITMPELAGALAAARGEKADPASLSRWLIRAGYRFKKKLCGRCGDGRVRTLLYEAANVMLTGYKGQLKLKDWTFAIAKRSTMRKARIALARRLGIIMRAMLRDGTEFASA
jgi:transposase